MKKTRLLEIIREEIAGALNEVSYAGKGAIPQMKKDPKYSTLSGDGKINAEKELKSGGTVELEEDQLNEIEQLAEMASMVQLKNQLEKQGKTDELAAVKAAEKATLDKLKQNPVFSGEGKNARLKGYVSALKKELKAEHDINLQDLLTTVMLDAEAAGDKFKDDIATNTIEKDAAAQVLGTEKGQRGRKADPNKPEKSSSTGKRGRPAGPKKATLTPGDDGFDKVTYSDDSDEEIEDTYYNDEDEFSTTDTEGPSSKEISSDETAKELGQVAPVSKDENFDRIRTGLMNKAKKAKGELSPEDRKLAARIINTAKEKYKFNATQVDALRSVAGL
jgi:hypothetical protein